MRPRQTSCARHWLPSRERERDVCARRTGVGVAAHLAAVGLPDPHLGNPGGRADAANLVHLIEQDKKVACGKLTFILVRGVGEAFIARDVEKEKVTGFLERTIAAGG